MEEKLMKRMEITDLKHVATKRIMSNFMVVMGLATLVAFTFVIIFIAILSQGALIYYYEPNKVIWIAEVVLGFCAVIVGIRGIQAPLRESLMLRSLRRNRLRTEIVMYLYKIYPTASYPADIATNIGVDPTNILGGLQGMGSWFGESNSLIGREIVEKIEQGEGIYYRLSEPGKSLIESLGRVRR